VTDTARVPAHTIEGSGRNQREVWKFDLRPAFVGDLTIEMPLYAKVLLVDMQGKVPRMWCEVDPQDERVERHFRIFGTGHHIPRGPIWCGSFLMDDGALVWHLYETTKEADPA